MKDKILIIRMADPGDVLAIGLPALRYFQHHYPQADITFLTHGNSATFIEMGAPGVPVITLPQGEWSDNIVEAMEQFLGLAEKIVAGGFTRIINFDTAFMPCFLARFLKDAGEPIEGNVLSYPIGELITGLQQQTLSQEQVNNPEHYISSSWLTFGQWFTPWWESPNPPEQGYPGFFLNRCCNLTNLQLDMQLPVSEKDKGARQVSVCLDNVAPSLLDTQAFLEGLQRNDIRYTLIDSGAEIESSLSQIAASSLLITQPSAYQWYATATQTPVLLVCGDFDPRLTMPDFATNRGQTVDANTLVNDVIDLLKEQP
ncbi:hypothetical protein OCL06_10280 [Alteromonas sp. ASW11-19]|uniref:Glycosyltransferase family 9 protein n=1 Tax=Alteromonas salexigens TaxID=2982530 RepID=A0ABT2VQ38_9ALTE|nr:hypothetical protein [Alteromonas salexigens]MCU7554987.1 hypothetical protein [Alteromonas salexigens]